MSILILFLALTVIGLIKLSLRPANFPPGPKGIPLLGYGPLLQKNVPIYKAMQKLAGTYGSVTGFFVGPTQPFVSVVGPKAAKEALMNEDLNGRPNSATFQTRTFGESLGLMFADGANWHEQRRFSLRHLRDLGFGKTSIEDQMLDEIKDLISDIKSAAQSDPDNVVDFEATFTVSVINVLWAIIGGKRFHRDDVEFKKLLENISRFLRSGKPVAANLPIPAFVIRLFPSILKMIGLDSALFLPLQKFISETIEEHLATRSKGDAPRDFFDVYLDEMTEQARKSGSTSFNKKQLISATQDLFAAGSDTTASSIGFAILYLIKYPMVQRNMQAELDDICGDSLPSFAHRPNLPYTEAVLMEVLRVASIAPLTVPHRALKDTQLQGFTVPKGSIVVVNLDSVFQDKNLWNDPENFRPERHLNKDGKLIKTDAFTPFGIGKRMCLGEALARNTVFLFTSALVKTFEFKPLQNQPFPSTEPIDGFTLSPKPFKATAILRIR